MKKSLKKMASICAAVVLSFSVVSCGSSEKNDKSKSSDNQDTAVQNKKDSKGNSPDKAVQNFIQSLCDADVDDICSSIAPDELWDYVCKDTGLSREEILEIILGGDLEECASLFDDLDVEISEIKIGEKNDSDDEVYDAFGKAMSKAGIKKDIKQIYDIDDVGPDLDFMAGWAYEIDNKWYFGPEEVIGCLIDAAMYGSNALPEEYDDEDYDYDFDFDFDDIIEDGYDAPPVTTEQKSKPESNGVNLCADSSNWANWSNEDYGCASDLRILSDGAALEIAKAHSGDTYYYYNQLTYENVSLEKNATYQLDFDIESTEELYIEYLVQQNYDPYDPYFGDIVYVPSSSSKHYSLEFTMPNADNDISIAFNCNSPDIPDPYTVSVHNLTLVRIS